MFRMQLVQTNSAELLFAQLMLSVPLNRMQHYHFSEMKILPAVYARILLNIILNRNKKNPATGQYTSDIPFRED